MSLCEQTLPDMVIVNDIEQARPRHTAGPEVGVVLATDRPLDRDASAASDPGRRRRRLAAAHEQRRRSRSGLTGCAAPRGGGERCRIQAVAFTRDLERDQRAGRYIQMGMLPPNPMAIEGSACSIASCRR
jgi:hypothetical protein